ncbi:WD40-repeat-containing domain protein [Blastocladiella britannica]|nr:WD40-repeat-containing domain protein [Blastocladiella britannica]
MNFGVPITSLTISRPPRPAAAATAVAAVPQRKPGQHPAAAAIPTATATNPATTDKDDSKKADQPVGGDAGEWVVVGGGGGPGKTGLTNQLAILTWSDDRNELTLTKRASCPFDREEDSPWSLAVSPDRSLIAAGVNGARTDDKSNRNCRIFSRSTASADAPLHETKALVTVKSEKNYDDYQCASEFSPSGAYLATGSDQGQFTIHHTEGLEQLAWSPVPIGSKVFTVAFTRDSTKVLVTAERALKVFDVKTGELVLDAVPPTGHVFRSGRIGPGSTFYTLVNRKREKCILSVWDLTRPTRPIRSLTIASKPAVSFAVDRDIVAVALADCSLHIYRDLRRVAIHPNAHDVPIQALAISRRSPTAGPQVLSGSGDGQLRTWPVSHASKLALLPAGTTLVMAIMALMVAMLMAWLVVSVAVPADQLIASGVPFWKIGGGSEGMKVEFAHAAWVTQSGLDWILVTVNQAIGGSV